MMFLTKKQKEKLVNEVRIEVLKELRLDRWRKYIMSLKVGDKIRCHGMPYKIIELSELIPGTSCYIAKLKYHDHELTGNLDAWCINENITDWDN